MNSKKLTHIDAGGNVHMVDISDKPESLRIARAGGEVILQSSTVRLIQEGLVKKGDVLTTAQLAGIMAAKRTSELIPLCHPVAISQVNVGLAIDPELPGIVIAARVTTTGRTGAEMEALTAVSIAALTVYDMVKAVEKTAKIQNIRLLEKHGGQSGDVVLEA